ncbi:MAG: peptidyl-prolyl cis-trans isomerase [Thermodesulfobacteriota bacterium]|nr:peptidyl-prolyl cis-trans isomerase [Thermodesulfobacteriota bacterium]
MMMKKVDSNRIWGLTVMAIVTIVGFGVFMGFVFRCVSYAASKDVVVATINDTHVLQSELDRVVMEYKRKTGKKEVTDQEKQGALKSLVTRKLILQQPPVQALKQDKDVIEQVREFERNIIIARFLKSQVGNRLTVTDEELEKFYKENLHRFSSPPKVKASHILVRTEEEAEQVKKRLGEGGDFGQLAKEYSIDLPMALEGGSMGTIEKGKTLPVLEKTLFSLNVGETSDVVETTFGFHVLTVDEVIPAGFTPFQEVKDELKAVLIRKKEAKAFDDMASKLEKDADIEIFNDRVR